MAMSFEPRDWVITMREFASISLLESSCRRLALHSTVPNHLNSSARHRRYAHTSDRVSFCDEGGATEGRPEPGGTH